MKLERMAALTLIGLLGAAPAAQSQALQPGAVAPNFTKTQLSGGSVSLNTYAGKVRVLFMLGYG